MLKHYERPFSAEELSSLRKWLNRTPPDKANALKWFALWIAVLITGIVALIGIAIRFDNNPSGITVVLVGIGGGIIGLICILAAFFAYLVFTGHRQEVEYFQQFTLNMAPKTRAALDDGRAAVDRVEAVGVIVIEEFADEQSAFIYDLGDGTSFYLRGEEYYLDDPVPLLSPRNFEIVRAVANGFFLGVFNRDGRLEPELTVPMDEMPEKYVWGDLPKTETIIQGSPAEILKQLGYKSRA